MATTLPSAIPHSPRAENFVTSSACLFAHGAHLKISGYPSITPPLPPQLDFQEQMSSSGQSPLPQIHVFCPFYQRDRVHASIYPEFKSKSPQCDSIVCLSRFASFPISHSRFYKTNALNSVDSRQAVHREITFSCSFLIPLQCQSTQGFLGSLHGCL